jgi:hypothetical protein
LLVKVSGFVKQLVKFTDGGSGDTYLVDICNRLSLRIFELF